MDTEIWKPIEGYEGLYEVSSYGNVRSLPRNGLKGKQLKLNINNHNGYVYVCLSKENHRLNKRAHVLVAKAFLSPQSEQVNHKDGDKANNHVDNLEWCTRSENMRHAYRIGLEKPKGYKVICLDTGEVYETLSEAARKIFGGKTQGEYIGRVCRGERNHYKGMHFAYYDDYVNGTIPVPKTKYVRKPNAN